MSDGPAAGGQPSEHREGGSCVETRRAGRAGPALVARPVRRSDAGSEGVVATAPLAHAGHRISSTGTSPPPDPTSRGWRTSPAARRGRAPSTRPASPRVHPPYRRGEGL